MKLLIDATTTQDQFANRGIGVATKEVLSSLFEYSKKQDTEDTFFLLLFKSPTTLNDVIQENSSFVKTVDIGKCRVSGKFDVIWWNRQFLPAIRGTRDKNRADLYYSPYIFRGLPTKFLPTAAYVHDFALPIMNRYSSAPKALDWIRKYQYHASLKKLCRVDTVATNSDRTRKDLHKFVPCLHENTSQTIHLGIREDLKPKKPTKKVLLKYLPPKVLERGYMLYYGGTEVNKNVPGLIKSYAEFIKIWRGITKGEKRNKPPFLVLAGGDFTRLDMRNPQIREIRDLIRDLNLEPYIEFTGFYKDEHLIDLLNGATAFIHLSYYEGFGFSPLEAMRCGTPVVASDRSCYPEVLNDGAILVNPDEPASVARACLSLVLNPEEAERQGEKGLEWSKRYTWEKTAEQLYDMFKKVLEEKGNGKAA